MREEGQHRIQTGTGACGTCPCMDSVLPYAGIIRFK